MEVTVIRAHFDGEHILLLTVAREPDEDQVAWLQLSTAGLTAAYGENEPDYPLTAIKEPNPDYEGG